MAKKKVTQSSKKGRKFLLVIPVVLALIIGLLFISTREKPAPTSQQEIDSIVESLNLARDIDGQGCWLWDGYVVYDPRIIGGSVYNDDNGYGCRLNRITIGYTYSYEGARCLIQKEYHSLYAERWMWAYLNGLGVQPANAEQFLSGYNVMSDYYALRFTDMQCQKVLRDDFDLPYTPAPEPGYILCPDVQEAARMSENGNIMGGDLGYFWDICF